MASTLAIFFIGILAYAKSNENVFKGYPVYSEKSKVYTDFNGIIDKHPESDNKSIFQGEKSIQKRRLEVDRFDYTSPADAYGAGYNYNINAQPQTIVDPRYLLGAGLLATVGAVGAIGTLILAEKVDDFETRTMVLQTEINNLIDQIETLEDNNETDENPNTRNLDLNFFKIKDVEHDIKDCQDAVSSLCNFATTIDNLPPIGLTLPADFTGADSFNASPEQVVDRFNRIETALNRILNISNNLKCNQCR